MSGEDVKPHPKRVYFSDHSPFTIFPVQSDSSNCRGGLDGGAISPGGGGQMGETMGTRAEGKRKGEKFFECSLECIFECVFECVFECSFECNFECIFSGAASPGSLSWTVLDDFRI